ncbi:hypothetical protein SUGI_0736100 [Cryptomeria japonica]|nr:hypothetical protein SUGI_0736100 [Cryptomeria japonica]
MKPRADQKSDLFSKEFNDTFNGDQPRDLQKKEVGSWLYTIGLGLESLKLSNDVLSKLEELDSYLSKADQSDWRILNWALKPSMLALVQHRLLEHPCEEVRLAVASCHNEIIRMTALVAPYNDDILGKGLQLIVESPWVT